MSNTDKKVMLELRDVSISFQVGKQSFDDGCHHVLDSVSFKLYENETLGIIGRNGVGKTTMLRIMAGILAPTSGEVVTCAGKSASLLTLGLGHNVELSGRDNAVLSAMLQGASKREALGYLQQINEFAELGDSFYEPVKTYSAGMRARLGFTAALLTHVDILLVDEVLSVGDAQFRAKAEQAMKQRLSGDQTVVFVSHADPQVKALCDRVIWIDQGKICAQGPPDEVIAQYRASMKK